MKPMVYIIAVGFPLVAVAALYGGGLSTFAFPALAFIAVPMAELFLPGLGASQSAPGGVHRRMHDALLFNAFAMVWLGMGLMLWQSAATPVGTVEWFGLVLCAGVLFGAIGINVAHELGHRSNKAFQAMAKALLLPSLYTHFFIEHNRGHHRHIGTPADPATARRDEVVYAFWFRSVVGGWLSAWRIENHRLKRRSVAQRVLANEMGHLQALQVIALAAVGWLFGWAALLTWVCSATIGFLLLETVNYVEHYGLLRERLPNGRYERVAPKHSWTSDHPISRALLYELPRHADHHAFAGRPYGSLRHFSDAPQLPTGYAGMILLALVPPVYKRVVHAQLDAEAARLAS
ncbi:MAG: alkane 1-monooxygenase [Myxococcota bacterium]|nr:alkane 1-monooxygenase [Myxococcota bacterium]